MTGKVSRQPAAGRSVCRRPRAAQGHGAQWHADAQHPGVKKYLHVDVFLEELQLYLTTKKLTLTLLFATQIFLDAHWVLYRCIDLARRTLRTTWCFADNAMYTFYYHGYQSAKRYQRQSDLPVPIQTLRGMIKILREIDPDHGVNLDLVADHDDSLAWVLEWHPWLSGLLQYKTLQLGIDTIVGPNAHWRILINTVQLYEACRQYGRENGIDVSWPDLDALMALYDKDSLFAGRVPDTARGFLKTFTLIEGVSVMSVLPYKGHQERMGRNDPLIMSGGKVKTRTSPGGKRLIKARAYTALLFRNRLLHAAGKVSLLERSSNCLARIHDIVGDLVSTGAVALTRLMDDDANFAGRSLRPTLDKLNLMGDAGEPLRRGKELKSVVLLSLVEEIVVSEFDLLRCNVIALHLRAFEVLIPVFRKNTAVLTRRIGREFYDSCMQNVTNIVGWVIADWMYHCEPDEFGQFLAPNEVIRDVAEFLRSWTTTEINPIRPRTMGSVDTQMLADRRRYHLA
ncbi:hypothetical protein GGF32_000371 [Allomyces javanicus]|nr:hypothetical protein GGF32_000371 [Allomyces javanicus]